MHTVFIDPNVLAIGYFNIITFYKLLNIYKRSNELDINDDEMSVKTLNPTNEDNDIKADEPNTSHEEIIIIDSDEEPMSLSER